MVWRSFSVDSMKSKGHELGHINLLAASKLVAVGTAASVARGVAVDTAASFARGVAVDTAASVARGVAVGFIIDNLGVDVISEVK